jgi:molecular chaperone GrpE
VRKRKKKTKQDGPQIENQDRPTPKNEVVGDSKAEAETVVLEEQMPLPTEEREQDGESAEELHPVGVAEGVEEAGEGIETLYAEIDHLRAQADEYLEGWQRARAEFANFKKRTEREWEEVRDKILGEILTRYLDIIDDFDRALLDIPTDGENKVWAEGIELIHLKLIAIVESEGVEPIQAEGEIFDPNLHEAISYEETDNHQDGQVIEVIKQGYKLGDRILRHAVVRVAK